MATGYTATIAEGISFNDFALQCARSFGALILMRDDPMDKPIPKEFKPSDYHSKKIVEIMKELKLLESLPESEANKRAEQDYQTALDVKKEGLKKANKLREKYLAMLVKVQGWTPPTSDHTELKKFMVEQIEQSIKFDCLTDYYTQQDIKLQSGKDWLAGQMQKLADSLTYHIKEDKEEKERTAGRNRWVQELRKSLVEKQGTPA
jgi:hypothetical protein